MRFWAYIEAVALSHVVVVAFFLSVASLFALFEMVCDDEAVAVIDSYEVVMVVYTLGSCCLVAHALAG